MRIPVMSSKGLQVISCVSMVSGKGLVPTRDGRGRGAEHCCASAGYVIRRMHAVVRASGLGSIASMI